jgi:hypothetical protein
MGTLMVTPFGFHWELPIGGTLVDWAGIYYRPKNYTGPLDWGLVYDQQGYCDGFDSSTLVGFNAGAWALYVDILRGWHPHGTNSE